MNAPDPEGVQCIHYSSSMYVQSTYSQASNPALTLTVLLMKQSIRIEDIPLPPLYMSVQSDIA